MRAHLTANGHTPASRLRWPIALFLTTIFFLAHQGLHFGSGQVTFLSRQEIAEATAGAGDSARQISMVALAMFGLIVLIGHRGMKLRANGALGWLILCFLVWACVSLAWAEDTILTSKRLCILAALCLGALAVNKIFSLADIVRWTFFSCSTNLLLGLLVEVVHGEFQPFREGYRFSGMLHPNHQGWNCALLFLSGIAAGRTGKRARKFFLFCGLAGFAFLILTRSRDACAAALLSLAMLLSVEWTRARKLVVCHLAAFAFVLALLFTGDALYPALGKAILLGREGESTWTLSGRVPLWEEALRYAARRPIQGYGYNSFWTPQHELDVSEAVGWGVPGAHNGYLDLLLGVGLVGATIYVSILLIALARSLLLFRRCRNPLVGFVPAVLVFYTLVMSMEQIAAGPAIPLFVVFLLLLKLGFRMEPPKLHTVAPRGNATCVESQSPPAQQVCSYSPICPVDRKAGERPALFPYDLTCGGQDEHTW